MNKYKRLAYFVVGLIAAAAAVFGADAVLNGACVADQLLSLGIEECAE